MGVRDDVTIRVGADTISAEAAFGKLKTSVLGFTAGLIGTVGLTAALTASSIEAAKFETGMAEVSTLLDDTSGIKATTAEVKALAKQFATAPTEQAKALYQIISSGAAEAGKETQVLTAANKLAIGGITDVATAADGLTNILKGYNLETDQAGHVSDVLFAAMKAGKTTIGELSANFGNVGSLANVANVSLEETAAAVATLTTQGISTSQAVTQLRDVIKAVIDPSDKAKKAASALGIEFNAQALAAKGLTGFLADVQEKTGGNVEAAAKLFGGIEGLQGVLSLAGTQADAYAKTLDSITRSAGQTDIAVAKITDTSEFQARQFKANLAGIGESVGRIINAFAPFLGQIGRVIDGFDDGGKSADEFAAKIKAAAEDAGPIFDGLAGAVQVFAAGVKTTFNLLQIGFNAIASATADVAAVIAKALSAITFGDISKGFDETAIVLENRARELAAKIDRDMQDIVDAGESGGRGLEKLASAFSDGGAAADETAPKIEAAGDALSDLAEETETAGQTLETAATGAVVQAAQSLEELQAAAQSAESEYRTLASSGRASADEIESAWQRQEAAGKALTDAQQQLTQDQTALNTEQASGSQGSYELAQAYETLGITSSSALRQQAESARAAYDAIVRSHEPIEDQRNAWLRVAEAELHAAGAAGEAGQSAVIASLRAEAAINGQTEGLEALVNRYAIGERSASRYGEAAWQAHRRAMQAIDAEVQALVALADQVDRTSHEYAELHHEITALNVAAGRASHRNPDGSLTPGPRRTDDTLYDQDIASLDDAGLLAFRERLAAVPAGRGDASLVALVEQEMLSRGVGRGSPGSALDDLGEERLALRDTPLRAPERIDFLGERNGPTRRVELNVSLGNGSVAFFADDTPEARRILDQLEQAHGLTI